MGAKTSIGWTNSTVNPILARLREPLEFPGRKAPLPAGKLGFHCVKVSAECALCYAETFNERGLPERGTGLPYAAHSGRKVEIVLHRPALDQLLRWTKPRRIFWCSMTDLFGEFVPSEMIQECLDVAVKAGEKRGHVSQLLTKRPARMVEEISAWAASRNRPLPACVWPGFSAGDRALFWQRWPEIRKLAGIAAGPLWCSYEPAIGPLVVPSSVPLHTGPWEMGLWTAAAADGLRWIVVGGESGAAARPFDLQWARDVLALLRPAGIQCFVKQLGRRPLDASALLWYHHSIDHGEERLYLRGDSQGPAFASVFQNSDHATWHTWDRKGIGGENDVAVDKATAKRDAVVAVLRAGNCPLRLHDLKGADPEEWPEDLRVQDWPAARA